jgi:RNA polymerase sigma factor (sigma-70 family)
MSLFDSVRHEAVKGSDKMNDWQLITDYVKQKDEAAFSRLVRQHLDFVFSIAMRRTGRGDLAEETAQAVFLLLAQKAGTFNKRIILPSWLYRATCLIGAAALRAERTRAQKEKEAGMMISMEQPEEPQWNRLAVHLDEAMLQLSEKDRQAVLLRFYQNQSIRNTATAMHLNEDAAKKRIARALEKLRNILQRNQVTLPTATLGALLAERAIDAAPETLELSAINAAHLDSISSHLTPLAKAGELGLFWNQVRDISMPIAAALTLGLFIFGGLRVAFKDWPTETTKTRANVKPGAGGQAPISRPFASQSNNERDLILAVVDTSGLPIEGVQIRASFSGSVTDRIDCTTDSDGRCRLPFPRRVFEGLNVWAFEPRHTGKKIVWMASEELSLPATYRLELDPGQHLEGTVLDPGGNPVPLARVELYNFETTCTERETVGYHRNMSFVITDSDGKWALDFLTETSRSQTIPLKLGITHPEFAPFQYSLERENSNSNLVVHLESGVRLSGTVTAERGLPVVDGRVNSYVRGEWVTAQIEADGRFNFEHLPSGDIRLNIEVPGYLDVEKLTSAPGETEVRLVSHKHYGSGKLRGKVVDEAGQPVAGIYITMEEWKTQTDEDGRFAWNAAPDIAGEYNIGARHFEQLSAVKLASDGLEHEIVIKRQPAIHLRAMVRDYETKLPILRFRVLSGSADVRDTTTVERLEFIGEGVKGRFDLLDEKDFRAQCEVLQIEADGYQPFRLAPPVREITSGTNRYKASHWETDQEFSVELKLSGPISGVVLLQNRMPAANAEVALMGKGLYTDMQKPGHFLTGARELERFCKTGPDGVFSLPQTLGAERIVVAHESGFATLRIADLTSNVILQPWGRVDGILSAQGNPVADQEITLASEQWTVPAKRGSIPFSFIYDARTDAQGRFSFSKIPAGTAWVMRRYSAPRNTGSVGFCQKQQVQIRSGENVTVALGKSGGTLSGRFLLKCDNPKWVCHLNVHRIEPIDSTPFESGPEVSEFWAQSDGRFVIDDLHPGNYRLKVRVVSGPTGTDSRTLDEGMINKEVLSAQREFSVPTTAPGQPFPKIDLGEIIVEPLLGDKR